MAFWGKRRVLGGRCRAGMPVASGNQGGEKHYKKCNKDTSIHNIPPQLMLSKEALFMGIHWSERLGHEAILPELWLFLLALS